MDKMRNAKFKIGQVVKHRARTLFIVSQPLSYHLN